MRKSLKNIIGAGVIIGSLGLGSGLTGCASMYEEPIFRTFYGETQEILPKWAQTAGWRDYKEQKKNEEERARIELEQSEVPKLIAYNRWEDKNKDDMFDERNEAIGIGKREFNLNKEELNVAILSNNYGGKVVFRTWDSKNKLIGKTLIYIEKNELRSRTTGPNSPIEGDFMDNLKGAGPGDYLISATLDNGKKLYLPLTIK